MIKHWSVIQILPKRGHIDISLKCIKWFRLIIFWKFIFNPFLIIIKWNLNDPEARGHGYSLIIFNLLFRSKPIGPLGRYIKLTPEAAQNDALNSLLEVQLSSKDLKSFIVSCKEDRMKLDQMMENYWRQKTKQPSITQRKR